MQLVSKIFNLCGPDPPTSQTDRRTDDMRSQDRVLHYSASCGKKWLYELRRCFVQAKSAKTKVTKQRQRKPPTAATESDSEQEFEEVRIVNDS